MQRLTHSNENPPPHFFEDVICMCKVLRMKCNMRIHHSLENTPMTTSRKVFISDCVESCFVNSASSHVSFDHEIAQNTEISPISAMVTVEIRRRIFIV